MTEQNNNPIQTAKVLLVEDDPSLLKLYSTRLSSEGYELNSVDCAKKAIALIPSFRPDIVITDLRMDEMDGLDLFSYIQESFSTIPVIIITAHGTIKEAVTATNQGVFAFLTKPLVIKELLEQIQKALTLHPSSQQTDVAENDWRQNIITRSHKMENLLQQVEQIAKSNISVFVHGESGTGKELIAQAIHNTSPRKDKEFITVNCNAIPADLLESELFGHSKGAFSGASSSRKGLFEAADGGSLFLDEIGDMSADFQVKLLRALQEGEIRPVGSNKILKVDVRIISASHRNLKQMVADNTFREDLYYRLNVVTLSVPPLTERLEDIPLLVNHFINKNRTLNNSIAKGLSNEAMELLISYNWPGNIRQLKNIIDQACIFCTTPLIPINLIEKALQERQRPLPSFNDAKQDFERDYLIRLLQLTNGSVASAAKLAKRNRTEFYRLLNRYQLKPAAFKLEKKD